MLVAKCSSAALAHGVRLACICNCRAHRGTQSPRADRPSISVVSRDHAKHRQFASAPRRACSCRAVRRGSRSSRKVSLHRYWKSWGVPGAGGGFAHAVVRTASCKLAVDHRGGAKVFVLSRVSVAGGTAFRRRLQTCSVESSERMACFVLSYIVRRELQFRGGHQARNRPSETEPYSAVQLQPHLGCLDTCWASGIACFPYSWPRGKYFTCIFGSIVEHQARIVNRSVSMLATPLLQEAFYELRARNSSLTMSSDKIGTLSCTSEKPLKASCRGVVDSFC